MPAKINKRIGVALSPSELGALIGLGKRDYMALWRVCIDDTADQKQEEVVAAGILIGKISQWQQFHRTWNRKCRDKPRIEYFHGKELAGLKKQFAQFRDASKYPGERGGWKAALNKRDSLRDQVLLKSDVSALGYGLRIPAYEKVRQAHPGAKGIMGKDAFEYLLQICLTETMRVISKVDSSAKVAFVCDLDEGKKTRYLKVYAAWRKANPSVSSRAMGITFLPDESSAGLQAADMTATVIKKVFEDTKAGKESVATNPLSKIIVTIGNATEEYFYKVLAKQDNPPLIEE